MISMDRIRRLSNDGARGRNEGRNVESPQIRGDDDGKNGLVFINRIAEGTSNSVYKLC